jgi:hypothetical protein
MTDEPQLRAFAAAVQSVTHGLLDSLEKHPMTEDQPVPNNWDESRVLLRRVADDLMLCPDLVSAIDKMRDDKATLWVLVGLASELDDGFYLATLRRAFDSSPQQSDILPGQAFATYLLALASGPNPVWTSDFHDFYG